jgi:2-desacetyl-2-hydroxyethyl bacteriochlorophyllide A dehydrogenase
MRSLVCTTPGTLIYRDIPEPLPAAGRSILRIRRIGVCGTDLHAFQGTQPYFTYPRILGHELAGEVGGEAYSVLPYISCGTCIACLRGKPNCCATLQVCGVHIDGGMAEYLSVPTANLVPSGGLSLDALCMVEPLAIGAHGVARAGVSEGEWVVVMGAGPIGLSAVTFALDAGARVIVLDTNEWRLSFCQERLAVSCVLAGPGSIKAIKDLTAGSLASIVIDATGNLAAIQGGLDYLSQGGRYVLLGLQKEPFSFSHPEFHRKEATLMSSRNATRADFDFVISSILAGRVDPMSWVTARVGFAEAGAAFPTWGPEVIKAMIIL